MKLLIIEDEKIAAEDLKEIIKKVKPAGEIVAIINSVEMAISWFDKNQAPDLIFCDVHLSDGSCFDIFSQIEVKCPVIFTTAFDRYAVDAFKLNSIDYLLKPIETEKVASALKKYDDVRNQHLTNGLTGLQEIFQSLQPSSFDTKSRFMVKSGQTIKFINSENIALFEAEGGLVFLYTFQKKKFIVNYTLDQLEQQLNPRVFFRINRQVMLNINIIQEVHPYFNGRLHLALNLGEIRELYVSAGRSTAFKQWLDW